MRGPQLPDHAQALKGRMIDNFGNSSRQRDVSQRRQAYEPALGVELRDVQCRDGHDLIFAGLRLKVYAHERTRHEIK